MLISASRWTFFAMCVFLPIFLLDARAENLKTDESMQLFVGSERGSELVSVNAGDLTIQSRRRIGADKVGSFNDDVLSPYRGFEDIDNVLESDRIEIFHKKFIASYNAHCANYPAPFVGETQKLRKKFSVYQEPRKRHFLYAAYAHGYAVFDGDFNVLFVECDGLVKRAAWTSDGSMLAVALAENNYSQAKFKVHVLEVKNKKLQKIDKISRVGDLMWFDGQGLLVLDVENKGSLNPFYALRSLAGHSVEFRSVYINRYTREGTLQERKLLVENLKNGFAYFLPEKGSE